jgi:hypothetical protein
MSKRLEFIVSIEQPEGASITEVKNYISEAVSTWSGSLRPPGAYGQHDPGDPLWGTGKTTKVRPYTTTPPATNSAAVRKRFAKAHKDALEHWKATPGSNWYDVLIDHIMTAYDETTSQG